MLKISNFELMAILYMIALLLILMISAMITFKNWAKREQKYDVFMIKNNELTVLSGIPVRYCHNDIERVEFSKIVSRGSYGGRMRIWKKGALFGRIFLFDASAYRKKFAFSSTYEEIELVTDDLMKKLREHGITCVKK